jgi:hypothetical protein
MQHHLADLPPLLPLQPNSPPFTFLHELPECLRNFLPNPTLTESKRFGSTAVQEEDLAELVVEGREFVELRREGKGERGKER